MNNYYECCSLCPRNCSINRNEGKIGYCGTSGEIKVARAALHMWEEPCISGNEGSGAVFFSGCQLKCVFCQNYKIADGSIGEILSVEELTDVFFRLKEIGANNINLVTGDHYIPLIADSIRLAKKRGFDLPFVYNTSSYVKVESLKMLDGLIDVYLPDYKYSSDELAERYSRAKDYPKVARDAIKEMARQQGRCAFDDRGMIKKGVIVRHMLLPGELMDSKKCIEYLYNTYGNNIYISIMSQYTPVNNIGKMYPELGERVKKKSYNKLVDYAVSLGVTQGFYQDNKVAEESFIPDFEKMKIV